MRISGATASLSVTGFVEDMDRSLAFSCDACAPRLLPEAH
jgi:hypothetical protein